MGALYDRMKMDLELKNLSPKTVTCYLACMVNFVRHYGRSPVEMGEEEIRRYLHYLITEKKASQSSISQAYSAIKFFHEVTLGRPWNAMRIPRSKQHKKLPVVLCMEEVKSLFASVGNLKHRAILTTIYSGGLRLGEATHSRRGCGVSSRKRAKLHVRTVLSWLRALWFCPIAASTLRLRRLM